MKTLLLPLVLLPFSAAFCATYFVSNEGSDSWSGTSPDSAFATLQHAADLVAPGDSVLAMDGSYDGFDLRSGGTGSQPVTFATAGNQVWIDHENPVTPDGINIEGAHWVVVDGYNLTGLPRNGVRVALADHVTVRNCYCGDCYERGIFTAFAEWVTIEYNECCGSIDEHGIYHSNSGDHPVIRFNVCHSNSSCGIHMNGDLSSGGDGIISDALVEGNIIYGNGESGGSGINCDGVVESSIWNNLLYMNHAGGISLYMIDGASGSHHVNVYNNTIVQPEDGRWGLNINTGSTYASVLNNTVLTAHPWRGSISIDDSSREGFQSDFNLTEDRFSVDGGDTVIPLSQWQSLGYGASTQVCLGWGMTFADWQGGDYHNAPGSQALDSGTSLVQPPVTSDLDGVPRPQGTGFDIGCYESWPQGTGGGQSGYGQAPVVLRGSGYMLFTGVSDSYPVLVLDLAGRLAAKLIPCEGTALWVIRGCPAGVYLYAAVADGGEARVSGKLIVY
ncbi:MAG: right-handed parallel beta-helix repeat-containing protein [Candidatus Fermentibacteraceae bacterium]|nr:right-handed parallel beta-helix repeat-containing protein [Candidatus Fermentibacteraceae bacterium]MBN2608393.1 right-handed parallel beta-helix repeat-containing protein [Candidatus Fermentibacteraceae bacterium]